MAISGSISMEAIIKVMGNLMDEYGIRQNVCARLDRQIEEFKTDKSLLGEKVKEYNTILRVVAKVEQDIVINTAHLVPTDIDNNTRIKTRKSNGKIALDKQAIKIKKELEGMLIFNNYNSSEILNTREEYNVGYRQAYLIDRNIQLAVQTHSKTIRVKQLSRNIYDENTHTKCCLLYTSIRL